MPNEYTLPGDRKYAFAKNKGIGAKVNDNTINEKTNLGMQLYEKN